MIILYGARKPAAWAGLICRTHQHYDRQWLTSKMFISLHLLYVNLANDSIFGQFRTWVIQRTESAVDEPICFARVVPYSITSVEKAELTLVSWQSARRWLSHKPGGRLPLLSTRPQLLSSSAGNGSLRV